MLVSREMLDVQLERLEQAFGDKFFDDQRARMIWHAVEGLEYASVIEIADKFIREFKHAPLPKDFLDASREYTRSATVYKLGEIRPREIAKCFDCGDSGFVHVERLPEYDEWAVWHSGSMPCHCERGRKLIEAGRRRAKGAIDFGAQWNSYHAKSYRIEPAHYPASTFSGRPPPIAKEGERTHRRSQLEGASEITKRILGERDADDGAKEGA